MVLTGCVDTLQVVPHLFMDGFTWSVGQGQGVEPGLGQGKEMKPELRQGPGQQLGQLQGQGKDIPSKSAPSQEPTLCQ